MEILIFIIAASTLMALALLIYIFLQNKKNKSAFHWLHVSLKQLLYRNRHLFQISQSKTE